MRKVLRSKAMTLPQSDLSRHTAIPRWGIRIFITLAVSTCLGLLLLTIWQSEPLVLFLRLAIASLGALCAFSLFERWPRALPAWIARWVLQVVGVAVALPGSLFFMYWLSTAPGEPPFWQVNDRAGGFLLLAATGLLIAPWIALTALVRQKDAIARHQALAVELERSELSRQALDARLHLLQAQIEPHFLFNTLANVRALVAAGSDRAPAILDSLIHYLRASLPILHQPATLGTEIGLVRAYLELMQMRIPDRLTYLVEADAAARDCLCPPMTLMTLVENAVRHGIDPCEQGGDIVVRVTREGARCRIVVVDTGMGFGEYRTPGTGLASLQERLALSCGSAATLTITANEPTGTKVTIDLPWRSI